MGGHEENKGNYGIQRKGTGLESNAMDKDMGNGQVSPKDHMECCPEPAESHQSGNTHIFWRVADSMYMTSHCIFISDFLIESVWFNQFSWSALGHARGLGLCPLFVHFQLALPAFVDV